MTDEQEELIKKALAFLRKMVEKQQEMMKEENEKKEREKQKQLKPLLEESLENLKDKSNDINAQILKEAENAERGKANASLSSVKPMDLKQFVQMANNFIQDVKQSLSGDASSKESESQLESAKSSIENDPLKVAATEEVNNPKQDKKLDQTLSNASQDLDKKNELESSTKNNSSDENNKTPQMKM